MKILIAAAAVAGLMTNAAYAAADVKGEIDTAEEHLGYSVAAKDIDEAHMHMHHAINCIVGPKGAGFDAKEINPCVGRGNGAIPDSTDAAQKQKLQAAVDEAEKGLAAIDLKAAKQSAENIIALLEAAE